MTKTNWQDPRSTEIRSTQISGLQEAVGKIEESIGINTLTETNISLPEVYISNEDRFRIYQALEGKRNWLSSPPPIIKKNGVVITNDFEIDFGGGAVIFTTPISEADVLTADISYTTEIVGKQLSSEDYSSAEKEKLAGIETGANKYIHPENHPASMISLNDASNVEDSIAGIKENIASHQSETATNAHRASNISITDAEGRFTATNVESALNELFTSANNGKTAVATAITAKGVDASPTDTFPLLATKIGQIETGLKATIGTIPDFSSYGTSSVMYYAGTITGLSFTPKIVIFTYMDDYFVGEYQNNVSCIYSGILGSGKSLFKASSRYFVLGVENLLDFLPDGFKYSSAGQGTKKSNYTNVKYMAIG